MKAAKLFSLREGTMGKLILAALLAAFVGGLIYLWWNAPAAAMRDGTEPWDR